ncbi:plasmid mobilization protein [Natronorubrum sp. FCH18a]|uniref:plasmid mobilization protein n=1 Tax=Natronorubrum sp. FCH18a TaxID=3447018 RepID=UPI003F50D4AE
MTERDKQLTTYVTEEEQQKIRVKAAEEGYSGVSGWLRDLALSELEDEEGNPKTEAMMTAD